MRLIARAFAITALAGLLGGIGAVTIALAYGSWFQMQGPPGCEDPKSLAVAYTNVYVLCGDGRIYYRLAP